MHDDLTQQMGDIESEIDAALQAWHTPAIAAAVVRADGSEAVFVRGLADVSSRRAAGVDTLFGLASGSKSFNALLMARLAAQGVLDLDRPLSTLLPDWRLSAVDADRHASLRDLLSHRSGLPRHDAVWFGSPLSREALFRRLPHLPASAPLRSGWQYQNLAYMASAVAAERLCGKPWEVLIAEQVLAPLGMRRTGSVLAQMLDDPDHASPYRVDEADTLQPDTYAAMDVMAPCGGLHTSIGELLGYLRLLAARGAPLLSTAAFDELWRPDARVPGSSPWAEVSATHYGMGWFVTHYRGSVLVHHGGNLPGVSSMMAFLPAHGLALAILTNVSVGSVRDWLCYRLCDLALGLPPIDWSGRFMSMRNQAREAAASVKAGGHEGRRPDTRPSLPLSSFVGTYEHPGYGELVISAALPSGEDPSQPPTLSVHYNGFTSPLTHVHLDVFDTPEWAHTLGKTKLRFVTSMLGDVDAIEVHFEVLLPGQRFVRRATALAAEELVALAGRYDVGGAAMTVERNGSGLRLIVPGIGSHALRPLGDRRFAIEGVIEQAVAFITVDERPAMLVQTRQGSTVGWRHVDAQAAEHGA